MKVLTVKQTDGSVFAVPVEIIARHRAACYAPREFAGDIERSLAEDTLPLFAEDDYAVEDWAANNMNWCDVQTHAFKIKDADPPNHQEAWVRNEKNVIDWTAP